MPIVVVDTAAGISRERALQGLASVTTPAANSDIGGRYAFDVEAAYREYGSRCYALASRIVRDAHLAQDVVQDVFAGMVRAPDRFDPDRGSLGTFLLTLAHHRAVDLVRLRRRQTGLDAPDTDLVLMASTAADPADIASMSEQGALASAALRRLGAPEREVIVLAYFGGYSQSEIASRLGVPLGTVKSRTQLGLRRLREHLGVPAPARSLPSDR